MHEEQIGRFPSHLTFFRRQVLHAYTVVKYVHGRSHRLAIYSPWLGAALQPGKTAVHPYLQEYNRDMLDKYEEYIETMEWSRFRLNRDTRNGNT